MRAFAKPITGVAAPNKRERSSPEPSETGVAVCCALDQQRSLSSAARSKASASA